MMANGSAGLSRNPGSGTMPRVLAPRSEGQPGTYEAAARGVRPLGLSGWSDAEKVALV
jgi:hypothetical protein